MIDLYSNVCDDNDGDAGVGEALCLCLTDCASDMGRPASIVCWVAEVARASKNLSRVFIPNCIVFTDHPSKSHKYLNSRMLRTVNPSAAAIVLLYS